jgi:hypothetical protein
VQTLRSTIKFFQCNSWLPIGSGPAPFVPFKGISPLSVFQTLGPAALCCQQPSHWPFVSSVLYPAGKRSISELRSVCDSHIPRRSHTAMSHIAVVKTKVRDPAALAAACARLNLAAPVQGTARLYSGEATGLIVHLPGWTYPAVIDTQNGEVLYDVFEGRVRRVAA